MATIHDITSAEGAQMIADLRKHLIDLERFILDLGRDLIPAERERATNVARELHGKIIEAATRGTGNYNCLAKLKPGEPYVVFRGQDILAADLVERWADQAQQAMCPLEKTTEMRQTAEAMRRWPNRKAPD